MKLKQQASLKSLKLSRRKMLAALGLTGITGLTGCKYWPDDTILNQCQSPVLPEHLQEHPVIVKAWQGIDPAQLWDTHVHLIGTGDSDSGVWITPRMASWRHPIEHLQYRFYINASCISDDERVDEGFVERLSELMDAMPVVWFQVEDDYIGEVCVHEQQGELALGLTDSLSHDQQAHVRSLFAVAPDSGYSSEYNPALAGWIAGLSDCLAQGTMLLIDYGNCRDEYYHPQRSKGTMMCYYRHRGHDDPLWLPGLQDITADVDFTAVAEAASAAGLSVAGYATQGHFLMGAGLDQVLQQAQQEEAAQFPLYIEQVKKLTMPGDMGERFKVMALARGVEQPLRGFQFFDHRHRL